MSETSVIKPKVTSRRSGHVDGITLMAAVGTFPSAEITYHTVSAGITKAIPQDLAGKMAAAQNGIYTSLQKDTITIDDGIGNSKTFEGYIVNGAFTLATGEIGYRQTLIHKSAILNNLQTGIYLFDNLYRVPSKLPKGGNTYSSWMKACLEDMVESWQKSINVTTSVSKNTKDYMNKVHGENSAPRQAWDSILADSKDENSYLEAIAGGSNDVSLHNALVNFIRGVYSTASGSFLQSLDTFGSQFQIKYVPAIFSGEDSTFGKFVPYAAMIENGEAKALSIRALSLRTGISDIIPIGQVAVHGVPTTMYRSKNPGGVPTSVPPEVASFPESSDNPGRSTKTMAPSWLPINLDMGSSDDSSESPKDNLNAAIHKKTASEKVTEKQKVVDTVVRKAIVEWAKNMYVDLSISGAVAEVSVKLDLSWELGKPYAVQAMLEGGDGVDLFTGFLSSITHTISSNPASPRASTSLLFTHVRASGFSLPGL